jgi:diguanylate cyclase (GGDEF)-like protein
VSGYGERGPARPTIGVLTPFVGSQYFGPVLAGLAQAAKANGGRVVAIQTLDCGTDRTEVPEAPDYRLPTAMRRVSAFMAITNAVPAAYLNDLRAAGKPVVLISHEYPEYDGAVVLPDNRQGAWDAVSHLIAHGHRRIAFGGYLAVHDIRQRYDAYREALHAHGITPDPDLFFDTANNHEPGGDHVARQMIEAGLPCTAIVMATDYNALGVMRTLNAAGLSLPRDQAIVGFDDIIVAPYTVPSLTSMAQPSAAIGAAAVDLVLRELAGEAPANGRHYVTMPLITRDSCGCALGGSPRAAASPTSAKESIDQLLSRARTLFGDVTFLQDTLGMQYAVGMDLLRSHEEEPRGLGWLERTRARAGYLGLWSDGQPAEDPTMAIVGRFTRDNSPTHPDLPTHPAQRDLPAAPATPEDPAGPEPPTCRLSEFPPEDLLAYADAHPDEIAFVVPVRSNLRDWGMLAIVSAIETPVPTGRAMATQWGGLLTVALQHEAVIQALREREEKLQRVALYDELTGLPNRALFLDRLIQVIARTKRQNDYHFAVLFFDLDGFKVVNDSLGHSIGDDLLVQASERVRQTVRAGDTVARFGGDELLLLLDGLDDLNTPIHIADRVQHVLDRPFHLAGQDVVITASVGIALSATSYDHPDEVVRDADTAMYWAKNNNRGSYAIFDVAMHARAVHRLQTESELRQALERSEFEPYYQPIVDLRSGEITAFEALIRWNHPTRGLVPPNDFLPVADESGLMLPIGRLLTRTVCRQLAQWQAGGPVRVSVNLSNQQFWHHALLSDIDDLLATNGLDPCCLVLEITEGVIMHSVDAARKTLEALHERGLDIHIDDFGTGYSSLEALHRLPIHALKIDRSFVSQLGVDQRGSELVRTIVLMGHNLGIELIAEGIETADQQAQLTGLGCQFGQGYLFSKPVPADQAGALIRHPG